MRPTRVCLWSLLLVLAACSVGWAQDPPLRFWTGKFYDYSTRANDIPDGTLATSHNWVVFTQNTGAETTIRPVVSATAHFPVAGVNPSADPGTFYRWTRDDLRPGAFRLFNLSVPPLAPGVPLEFTASRSADKTTFSAPGYQKLTVTMTARRSFTFVRIGTPGPLDTWNIETDDYYAVLVNGQATRRGSDGGLKQQIGLQVERYDLLGAATLAFTSGIDRGDTIDAELTFYVMPRRGAVQFIGYCRIMAELWHTAHVDTGIRAEISSTDPEGNTLDAMLTFDGPSSEVFVLEGVTKDATFEPPTGAIALPATLPVDILPGVFPNAVDWTATGTVPVAILGSSGLPVSAIDAASIRFGAAGTEAAPIGACDATQDVSGDGLQDLVCSFDRGSTGLNPNSTVGALTATVAGTTIIVTGRDSLAPTVPPGAISGRVTDAYGPIIGARVIAIDRLTLVQAASTSVNDSAEFVLGNLRPGDYLIRAEPPVGTYLAFGYYPNATSAVAAGTVTVESGQTRPGIVVTLGAGTSISGTVGFDGPPPADPASIWRQLSVTVQNMTGSWSYETAAPINMNDGTYVIPNLPPGTYSVGVPRNATGYEPQVYTNPQEFTFDLGRSKPVTVAVETPATGIDFSLRLGPLTGTLRGRVVGSDNPTRGLSEVYVRLDRFDSGYGAASALTDTNGYWSMPNVVSGEYTVWFDPYPYNQRRGEHYIFTQWKPGNDGKLSFQPSTTGEEIDLLPVPFLLPLGGGVHGSVTAGASPLNDIEVAVHEMGGGIVAKTRTNALGVYHFNGLEPRHYNVRTYTANTPGGSGYLDQWWNGRNCIPNCGAVTGDPLAVSAGQIATANFNLGGQPATRQIRGTVRADADGGLLARIEMEVFTEGGQYVRTMTSQSDGTFVIADLPAGRYRLLAYDPSGNYFSEWYDNVAQQEQATLIDLTDAITRTADVSLAAASSIAGLVTDTSSTPLRDIEVVAVDTNNTVVATRWTDDAGHFHIGGLRPGTYVLNTNNRYGWANEIWNNIPLSQVVATLGTKIEVRQNENVGNKNFQLDRGARLSGTVRTAAGHPLSGIQVNLRDATHQWRGGTRTNDNGEWVLSAPAGTFYIVAEVSDRATISRLNLIDQLYTSDPVGGVNCLRGECVYPEAAKIVVEAGDDRGGLDLALEGGRTMEGTVRENDPLTGQPGPPLQGIAMEMMTSDGVYVLQDTTKADGSYRVQGLPPGQYRLLAYDPTGTYVNEWFNDQLLRDQGMVIDLTGGNMQFFGNVGLSKGGRISGSVTEAGTGVGIRAQVWIYQNGVRIADIQSDAMTGAYTSPSLPPGGYTVRTMSDYGVRVYIDQWANAKPCTPNCESMTGDAVTVVEGQTTMLSFSLSQQPAGGQIAGRIIDAVTGYGLANAVAVVFPAGGGAPVASSSPSDSTGNYVVTGLAPGFYGVSTDHYDGYVNMLYRGVQCPGAICQGPLTPVEVRAGATTAGIDFPLSRSRSISGTVRADADGGLLARIEMEVFTEGGQHVRTMTSQSDGTFVIADLPAGRYRLLAYDPSGNYFSEWYDNVAQQEQATLIDLTDAITRTADVSLAAASSIAGLVTDTSSNPLRDIEVVAVDVNNSVVATTWTNNDGNFHLGGLRPGTYVLNTNNRYGWANEIWNNIPLSQVVATLGTKIEVRQNENVGNKNFQLDRGARLSGTVRTAAGHPLSGIQVNLRDGTRQWRGGTRTNDSGEWVLSAPAGTFFVVAEVSDRATLRRLNLVDQLYTSAPVGGVNCHRGECTYPEAAGIVLAAGDRRDSLDLVLEVGRTVGGIVTDDSGGAPLAGIAMEVFAAAGAWMATAGTEADGSYQIIGLPAGTYRLLAYDPTRTYLDEWFNNETLQSQGLLIDLLTEPAFTGNVGLSKGGRISGAVTEAGNPAAGITAQVWIYQNGVRVDDQRAEAATGGAYTSKPLPPGNYTIRTMSNYGGITTYEDQLYQSISCASSCAVTTGTPVTVSAGGATAINFGLQRFALIRGTVTNAAGTPLTGVSIRVYNSTGSSVVANTTTGAGGSYTVSKLLPGTYYVRTMGAPGYLDEAYNDVLCVAGTCAGTTGTPIALTWGETKTGIDFGLAPGSAISGRVTNTAGAKLSGVSVSILNANGSSVTTASTGSDGNYLSTALPAGRYYLRANGASTGYVDQIYDGLSCPGATCSTTMGMSVSVDGTNGATGVDFRLDSGGTIQGTLTDATNGAKVGNVQVRIYTWPAGTQLTSASTPASGASAGFYAFKGLPAGTYLVSTSNAYAQGFADQSSDGTFCPQGQCDYASTSPVTVQVGQAVVANLNLTRGGSITGDVSGNAGTFAVNALDQFGRVVSVGMVTAPGSYTLPGIPTGSYVVRTVGVQNGYLDEFYNDVPCSSPSCSPAGGTPVQVTAGQTTGGIDFGFAPGKTVSGRVTAGSGDGPGLQGVTVRILTSTGSLGRQATTDAEGWYTVRALRPGTYFARTSNSAGFIDQLYEGQVSILASGATVGTPIEITETDTDTTINFALQPGARIAGTVTDSATGAPISGMAIAASVGTTSISIGTTNASGQYNSTGLPSGTYYVRTSSTLGYANEIYDNIPVAGTGWTGGTAITVTEPTGTTGIDFALGLGGRISGVVIDAQTNLPVQGVRLTAFYSDGVTQAATAITNMAGRYILTSLTTGAYYVRTGNKLGYIDEVNGGQPCLNCDVTTAAPVAVSAPVTTVGVDFALERARVATNDSCAGPTVVNASPFVEAVSTLRTSTEPSDPRQSCAHYPRSAKTVWYQFRPPSNGVLTLSALGSGYDTIVSVHTGFCGATAELAGGCVDDTFNQSRGYTYPSSGNSGILALPVVGQTTYLIEVAAYYVDGGTLVFSLSFVPSNAAPVANAGPDQVVEATSAAGAAVHFDGSASSDAEGDSLTYAWSGSFGTATGVSPAVALPIGTHVITLTVDDSHGATSTDTLSVTVRDSTPPAFTVPADLTVAATSDAGAPAYFYVAPATDTVSGSVPVTCGPSSGTTFPQGLSVVTCSATDAAGNTRSASFSITVLASGQLKGRIVDAVTGNGVGNIQVSVHKPTQPSSSAWVSTGPDGSFQVSSGLLPGDYYIKTSNNLGYVDQLYAGIACVPCTYYGGTPVPVGSGQLTDGIEFRLSPNGYEISGVVRALGADGVARPVANALAYLTTAGTFPIRNTRTDADGAYRLRGLVSGTYFVTVSATGYPTTRYGYGAASTSSKFGDPLVVEGVDRTQIDITLSNPSTISGAVTRTDSGPLSGIQIRLHDAHGQVVGSATTNASGAYTIQNVGAGIYYVATYPGTSLVHRLFRAGDEGNVDCLGCDVTSGTPIVIPETGISVTGINLAVSPGTRLSGTIRDDSGNPLRGVGVDLFNSAGQPIWLPGLDAYSDTAGRYTNAVALPPGRYFARTYNITQGRQEVLYGNLPCVNCDVTQGTAIDITAGTSILDGIDFALPPLPEATNDDCATALAIDQVPFSHVVTTTRTSGVFFDPLPTCSYLESRSRSVWYRYDAGRDGFLTLDTTGSNYDTSISVWTGSCSTLAELPGGCNDDMAPTVRAAKLTVPVTAGQTYYILVNDYFRSGGMLVFHATERANQAPRADAGPDLTIEATGPAGATVTLDGSASIDPDGESLTYTWTGAFGTATGVSPAVALPIGTHVITLTVDDGHGATATDTVTFTVRDSTPPTIIIPAPMRAEATGPNGTIVSFAATATDTVGADRPVSCIPVSGSVFPLGETAVQCSASDAAGNVGVATFTVSVADTTPPVLHLPAGVAADASTGAGATVIYTVTATDIADPTPTVLCTPASGSVFAVGSTLVTCSATDRSGNSVVGTFSVAVNSPKDVSGSVLAEIQAQIQATSDESDAKKLEAAADHLGKAFASSAWIDPLRLDAKKGEEVFQEHKNTVNKLRDLLKDKKSAIPDATLTEWIDRLVTASRVLATTAIEDSREGDVKKLEKAAEELAKGDEAATQDDWGKAIEYYRSAWKQAMDAVK